MWPSNYLVNTAHTQIHQLDSVSNFNTKCKDLLVIFNFYNVILHCDMVCTVPTMLKNIYIYIYILHV